MTEVTTEVSETAQGDTGTGDGGEGRTVSSWLDALPEDLKGNEALKSFEGPEALAKAYLDTKGKVPEVPESPDAYEIPIQTTDEISKGLADKFRAWSHGQGLTKDQAKNLATEYFAYSQEVEQSIHQLVEKAEKDGIDTIRKEWGADFDSNLVTAKKAAIRFGGEDFAKYLEDTKLGSHPAMLRMMHSVGKAISEDTLIEGGAVQPRQEYTPAGTPMFTYDKTPGMKK